MERKAKRIWSIKNAPPDARMRVQITYYLEGGGDLDVVELTGLNMLFLTAMEAVPPKEDSEKEDERKGGFREFFLAHAPGMGLPHLNASALRGLELFSKNFIRAQMGLPEEGFEEGGG